MLDIQLLRRDPGYVEKAARAKGVEIDINHILEIDSKYRELVVTVQKLREERNKLAKDISGPADKKNIEKGRKLKDKLQKEEHALKAIEEEMYLWLYKIPNPAKPDVKIGKDESENEVIRKYKEPGNFSFAPLDHLDLGERLDIIDVKRAVKISGARFAYLKKEGALLEFALIQFAFDVLVRQGFVPIVPPVLVHKNIMQGLGYWQKGDQTDYYLTFEPDEKKEFYLIGTAEHSIVPMHKDEVFSLKEMPKRYVGFSTAFRRESGSYGKDTKGILRVHQFDKVEMVSFTQEGEDDKEQEYLLSLEEKLFQLLDIPYQVVKMCSADLGFPAARKYDLEAWLPGQNRYREVTSVSTVTDFQSRRLNIRYQEGEEKKFAQILNGTAFAIGRAIIAILENYQQEDGSVIIPEVLKKYTGFEKIPS